MDSGVHKDLDRVINHRLVIDRQEMFVRNPREGVKPTAGSASKHHAFHLILSLSDSPTCQTPRPQCILNYASNPTGRNIPVLFSIDWLEF